MSAEALVKVYPRLRLYARSLTRDRENAEDLLQSTAVKALSSLHMFREGSNFDAWVFRVMRNLFLSQKRKSANKSPHLDITDPVFEAALKVEAVGVDNAKDILERFRSLTKDQRDSILMSSLEGMSVEEIARATNVSAGTVKSRISRGRAAVGGTA